VGYCTANDPLVQCSRLTGFTSVHTISRSNGDDVFLAGIEQWITSFFATTLACNFTATAFLAYRLWTIERSVRATRVGQSLNRPALMIVIDAGILYSTTLLAALICFAVKSNGQYVVLDMIPPIISIAFYIIILRVAISSSRKRNHGNTSGSTLAPHGIRTIGGTYHMRPMQVHIDQFTEADVEAPFQK